jgi:hypothetical protein
MVWTANHLWGPDDREAAEGYGLPLLRRHIEFWVQYVENPQELLGLAESSEFVEHQGLTQSEALRNRKEAPVPMQWLDADGVLHPTTNGLWQNGAVLNKLIRAAAGDSVKVYQPHHAENPDASVEAAVRIVVGPQPTPATPTCKDLMDWLKSCEDDGVEDINIIPRKKPLVGTVDLVFHAIDPTTAKKLAEYYLRLKKTRSAEREAASILASLENIG